MNLEGTALNKTERITTVTVLQRLRRIISPRPLETTYDDAPNAFEEYHAEALSDARDEAESIQTEIATAVVELESGLSALESFEHDLDRVEDVVSNVARKRRALLENLSLKDDPAELRDSLATFLEDRSDLSQKEAAILKQIELPSEYREAVDDFKTSIERLDRYLSNEYELVESQKRLQELVADRREQLDRIAQIEEKIAELDPESVEAELEAEQEELNELLESDLRNDYEELEQQLEAIETERDEIVSEISSAAAESQRGLRKLIYAIENEGAKINTDLEVLKELRDGKIDAILNRDPNHVECVIGTVANETFDDHLDESEQSRLFGGLERLENLSDRAERIKTLDSEQARLEERIQSHEFQQRKRQLKQMIESLEQKLDEIRAERQRLEERLNDATETKKQIETKIKEVLEEQIPGDVTLEKGH